LMLVINAGIFFYDSIIGLNGWVFVYYIPFLFVSISLFSYKSKLITLTAYVVLPIVLFLVARFYLHSQIRDTQWALGITPYFSVANFLLALLLVALFAFNIIKGNLDSLHQIERNRLHLQALIDNTADSVWSIDDNNIITSANMIFKRDMKTIFGVDVRPGFDMNAIYARPDFPAIFKEHHRLLFEMGTLHDIYRYFGNRHYEVFGTTYHNKQGELSGASFHVRDITDIIQSGEELQQAFINLQTLIDNTHASIWSVDTNYKVIAANRIYKEDMRRIFQVEMVPGFDIGQLFSKNNYPSEWLDHYKRVFAGETFQLEYSFEEKTYELMVAPIFGLYKSIIGAAFYARNVTQRKRNEIALLEAKEKAEEATKAKAQFLSNISHELRTPLNGIVAITRIMLGEPTTGEQQKNLEVLKYSGDHMLSLIDDVLDFNKIEADKVIIEKVSFNLQHTLFGITKAFAALATEKNILFEVNLPDGLNQLVNGDITRITQVMNNLLGNAFKFTPKGKVIFSADVVQQESEKMQVKFTVSDTGIGIAADKLDLIFESFTQADVRTTRKYGGTGLGLTISKRLVQLMEGTMWVNSKPGVGTTFTIELGFALARRSSGSQGEKGINELKKFTGVKVLLAEDNPINLMVACNILKKWEMDVTPVKDGQEALDAMESGNFDIVLMDLEMPVLDGAAATKQIRLSNQQVPIIAFTAASYENMKQELLQNGMTGFVPKPFKPEYLHQCIADALKQS
jgi:signal transduction histidine kinase/CheY-like chemotaxis protein